MASTSLSALAAAGRFIAVVTGVVRDRLGYFVTQKYTDVVASKLVRKL